MGDCTRWRWPDPVSGEEVIPSIGANVERCSDLHVRGANTPDPCGPAGKHWVEAPPLPPPAPVDPPWWRRLLGGSAQTEEVFGDERMRLGRRYIKANAQISNRRSDT